MVMWALNHALGGELFVPKIPSYRICDVAEAIGPSCTKTEVGIRPGEKIHEEMITSSDSETTVDLGQYYAILPNDGRTLQKYKDHKIKFQKVPNGFSYNSKSNPIVLSVSEIRELIKENIDNNFRPT